MIHSMSRAALAFLAGISLGVPAFGQSAVPAPQAALAQAAAPGASAAPVQNAVGVAPIRYQSRTLANGLRVYAIRDTTSSNVSVQVWYDVGSRDDPQGRSGFAHLFEHMMFKSTRNMVPEQFDRLTEDVGGFNNASTNDDYTNYFEAVPANHLQRLLWAEAERMGSLVVEAESFASEREVVKEEFRTRVLASPYGRLFYLHYPQISYDVLPYGRPGIGSMEDLDAATIEDVRAFHATYYRPDNAVLVVAGNFDPAQLDRWVDSYFGPIARPAGQVPRVRVVEPVRTQARRFTVFEPTAPLPAVLISYPAPAANDADSAAMEVLDGILSTGESSRLHQALVYRDQIAAQASSFPDLKQARGSLAVFAILSTGQTGEDGEAALRREVARFRDEPVSAAELAEAKNELLTGAIRERETADGQASAIAEAVIVRGDPAAADRRLARIAAVTAADVQRVARTWLREERSAAVLYLPEEMRNGRSGDRVTTAPTVYAGRLMHPADVAIVHPAPAGERVAPPPVGAEVAPAVPAPVTRRLANGLTVVTVPSRALPLVTIALVANGGSAADPPGRAGTAVMTASVMTEGTTSRSAAEIDAAVEALGTSLVSQPGWDGTRLGLTVRTAEADRGLALIADIVRNPALAEAELERQRAIGADAFRVSIRDPGAVAEMAVMRALYGEGPYAHPQTGTAASLAAISRADVQQAYRDAWRPENATLILTGDLDPARGLALAERHLGSWRAPPVSPPIRMAPSAPRTEVIVIDMPGAGQAAIAVARNTLSRGDPHFYRALVANAVLGGGYSARLNQEIRIRRGLSYGAGSNVDARREGGPFLTLTQTRNDAAAEVLGLVLGEMRRLGAEPIPAAELNARRSSLTGDFGRSVETTSGIADLIVSYIQRGVAPEEIERYQRAVLAVTPSEAQAAAREQINPQGATIVVVGESYQFIDRLRREQANITFISIEELDLDGATLR